MFTSFTTTEALIRLKSGPIRRPRCQTVLVSIFADEQGAGPGEGNTLGFMRNEQGADRRFECFLPDKASGLAPPGLSRLNQSKEAFVYCVLGAQVNVCSSILDDGGPAKEAQSEFLVLLEDAVRQPDLAKSVQRYQPAVDQAKVRLDLVTVPGVWLMPSRILIHTDRTATYNNKLRQATPDMKLGINNCVNTETKKTWLRLMDRGPPKINLPNTHPSNPIQKAAQKKGVPTSPTTSLPPDAAPAPTSHDINKVLIVVRAVILAGLLVWKR